MDLFNAILSLHNKEECVAFFKDLCTPKEIEDLQERWQIAKLLAKGNMSYREIKSVTNASLTTITRVARFLNQEQNFGYKLILDREEKNEE